MFQDGPEDTSHTDLDCLFRFGSSAAKMCTVPWSLDTQMREASWLKLMLRRTEQKHTSVNVCVSKLYILPSGPRSH